MDIKEIRIKTIPELDHLLHELRVKLDDLKFKVAQKQLKNIRDVRDIKRDIARVLMVMGEKAQNAKRRR